MLVIPKPTSLYTGEMQTADLQTQSLSKYAILLQRLAQPFRQCQLPTQPCIQHHERILKNLKRLISSVCKGRITVTIDLNKP